MSTRIWFAFVALLITSGISGTAQERAPERVSLDALLTRAAWYLDTSSINSRTSSRSARARLWREARDSRRQLGLRRQQRAVRPALYARAAGPRVQPGLPACRGSAMNAYCS